MLKVGFISLGCAKNQVDFERLAGTLISNKIHFVSDLSVCDLLIINTCGFIQDAVNEAIEAILNAREELPCEAKLVVFGCMTERYKNEFAKELPEVDFFAGVGEEAMKKVIAYIETQYSLKTKPFGDRYLFNAPYYAYLKIAEGCNNRCTYCTIPSIRGHHKSVAISDLIREAKTLAEAGAKELIIISQDVTKYGSDLRDGTSLVTLIKALSEALPQVYFRLMYLNPDGVTEELAEAVKTAPNFLKYFDIPVQHGSDKILKLMNRHSDRKQIEKVFAMLREKMPEATIRTTVIVGFPGEDDKDFEEVVSLITEIKPDFAGFFIYSPEDGTKAAFFEGSVDEKTAKKRLKILQNLQKKNTLAKLKELKKADIICFVEKANDDFEFILEGRAIFQAPEIDGQLYVIDGEAEGVGPYSAKIKKIAYPDVYVELRNKI